MLAALKLENKIEKGIFISGKTYCFINDQNQFICKAKGVKSNSLSYSDYNLLLNSTDVDTAIKTVSKIDWTHGDVSISNNLVKLKWDAHKKREKVYLDGKWVDTNPLVFNDSLNKFRSLIVYEPKSLIKYVTLYNPRSISYEDYNLLLKRINVAIGMRTVSKIAWDLGYVSIQEIIINIYADRCNKYEEIYPNEIWLDTKPLRIGKYNLSLIKYKPLNLFLDVYVKNNHINRNEILFLTGNSSSSLSPIENNKLLNLNSGGINYTSSLRCRRISNLLLYVIVGFSIIAYLFSKFNIEDDVLMDDSQYSINTNNKFSDGTEKNQTNLNKNLDFKESKPTVLETKEIEESNSLFETMRELEKKTSSDVIEQQKLEKETFCEVKEIEEFRGVKG